MPGDASRQPPNGPALPGIDGDVFPAGLPLVVPRNADHVIGEIFRRRWHKLVGILQRRVLLQVGEGHEKRLLHLGGAGRQPGDAPVLHPAQNGVHDEIGPVGDKIQPPQHLHCRRGNRKLLLQLPQGALLRAFALLQPPAGKAHLSRLAAQGLGPDLVEQRRSFWPLGQRHQDGVPPGGVHQ